MLLVVKLLWLEVLSTPVESEREAETCVLLEFVKEVTVDEMCSLPLLVVKRLEISLSGLVIMVSDGFVPKLAVPALLVPDRVVLAVDTALDDVELDVLCEGSESVAEVVLFRLDATSVVLKPPVPGTDSPGLTVEDCVAEALEAAESIEECVVPVRSTLPEVAAIVAVRLVSDDCPIGDIEVRCDPLEIAPVKESIELESVDISTDICPELPISVPRLPVLLTFPVANVAFPTPNEFVEFPCLRDSEPDSLLLEGPEVREEDDGCRKYKDCFPVSRLNVVPSMFVTSPPVRVTTCVPTVT